MVAHSTGTKLQHCSPRYEMGLDQSRDEPASHPEELPLSGCLKGAHHEAFRKDSNLVKWIRQTYFRAHCPEFDSEITHKLAHVFKEMADIVSLLNTKIHQVQDPWPGKKELHEASHVAMSSTKDICYFWEVSSTEYPKILGLKGIHSLETLKCQGDVIYRWVTTAQKHVTAHTGNYFLNNSKAKCHLLQRLCMPERSLICRAVKKMMVSHDAGSNKLRKNNSNKSKAV